MNKMQEQVKEWHETFGVPVHLTPQYKVERDRLRLREFLIYEECQETCTALLEPLTGNSDNVIEPDLVEIFDGLCDSLFVIFGTALELGLDLQAGFDEVTRSNMSKMWTRAETSDMPFGCNATFVEKYGKYVVKRADGKILKGPNYSPANLKIVLKQLENEWISSHSPNVIS